MESEPTAWGSVFGTRVQVSFSSSSSKSEGGSLEPAWPGSAEGQFLIGVDVEMGATMGEEIEEQPEGDSEDGVSESHPCFEGTGICPEPEGRAERKRGELVEGGGLGAGRASGDTSGLQKGQNKTCGSGADAT